MISGRGIDHLAERLNLLFETVQPLGRPYKLREVANGVNARAGRSLLSPTYLSQLRLGDRRNPSGAVTAAIAWWFGVDTDYFFRNETQGLSGVRPYTTACEFHNSGTLCDVPSERLPCATGSTHASRLARSVLRAEGEGHCA